MVSAIASRKYERTAFCASSVLAMLAAIGAGDKVAVPRDVRFPM
jgi:hypothetical protein